MKILYIFLTIIVISCSKNQDKIDLDNAVEIVCPGVSQTLVPRVSADELREALRKKYTHDKTRDTVLKLKNKSNVMIPTIIPEHLNNCYVRDLPKIVIPSSLGY